MRYVVWSKILKQYRNHTNHSWVSSLEEAQVYLSQKEAEMAARCADDGSMFILIQNFWIMTEEEALIHMVMSA